MIVEKLQVPLKGWASQSKMSPSGAKDSYRKIRDDHKKAAVVLLLFEEEGILKSLLIKRSEHPEDKHSGQISLPGGQLEEGETYKQAAIREVKEEIGLESHQFEILGALSPIYVFVSNFYVQPYVAWLKEPVDYRLQDDEVAGLLFPAVDNYNDYDLRKLKDIPVRNMVLKDVPYFDLDANVLWGATAMIMSEFADMIK